jgi:integrase
MAKKLRSFRIGKVQAYLRGKVWYLCYHQHGHRHRPRVGRDQQAARQLAAQINAQLELAVPAALSFVSISIPALRERWLEYHEQVLQSSPHTIARYRTATAHLVRFLESNPVGGYVSHFRSSHAEDFVHYLRCLEVAPNGHAHAAKRPLMDKGIRYVLETCRALFNYAARRRHLPPFAENPFGTLPMERLRMPHTRAVVLFSPDQERRFLEACDDWQFPLFLTLLLTGLRSGELTHLLLPEDLDLHTATLRVRNKPELGWQVKTRNERDIPVVAVLVEVLRQHLAGRTRGPVFVRRRFGNARADAVKLSLPPEQEREKRLRLESEGSGGPLSPADLLRQARRLWQQMGAVREDRVRTEFMRLTAHIGQSSHTAPKMLRHLFATSLQEGRVDPLIRNELLGHVAQGAGTAGHGLAMTAVYTHTRPETRRQQLEAALAHRPAVAVAQARLQRKPSRPT